MNYIMIKERNISLRLEEEELNAFRAHCKENGFSISARIRTLLKQDIAKFKKMNEDG